VTYDLVKALKSLYPGSFWSLNGDSYSGLTWSNENKSSKPTEEELISECERLQAEYERTQYQRQRAPEYPDLKELADALYWNSKGDSSKLEEYYIKCEEIKNKYPKPQ